MALVACSNAGIVQFPKCTGAAPETATWFGIGCSVIGGSNILLFRKQLVAPLVINVNVQPQFAIGDLDVATTGDISEAWCSKVLLLLFQNADAAGIGDAGGLIKSTTAGSLFVSLHTADPGAGGNQATSECAYTSYARVAVARSDAGWTVA